MEEKTEMKSLDSKKIIGIGTIVLCILIVVLMFVVLDISTTGTVCQKTSNNTLDCGGATAIQFNYESGFLHTDSMIVIFLLMYSICIGVILSYYSLIKNKVFDFASTFLFIVSIVVVILGTVLLIEDVHYGNKPHIKDNQVLIDN